MPCDSGNRRLKCWVAVFTYENVIKRGFVVQPPNTISAAGINRIFTLLSRSKHSSMSFLLFAEQHLYKHVERILQSVQKGLSLFTVTDQNPSSKINNGQKKKTVLHQTLVFRTSDSLRVNNRRDRNDM